MHCDFSHSFVWLRCRHSSLCELFIACGRGFPKVSTFLYGTADPEKLTAEQKDTVANIMSLAGAGVGAAVGNTSANAVSGSLNAESAVENNWLYSQTAKQKGWLSKTEIELLDRLTQQSGARSIEYFIQEEQKIHQSKLSVADKEKALANLKREYEADSQKMEATAAKLPKGSKERGMLYDITSKMQGIVSVIVPYKESEIIRAEQRDWLPTSSPFYGGNSGFVAVQRQWAINDGKTPEEARFQTEMPAAGRGGSLAKPRIPNNRHMINDKNNSQSISTQNTSDTKGTGGKAAANIAQIEKLVEQERQALARIKGNYSNTERKNNLDYRYKPENSTQQLQDFRNQVREARKTAPSDSKKSGNVAVARIDIEGLDIKQMAGHSRLDRPKGNFVGEGKTVFHYETIKTLDNRNLPRNTDSEYKILSNLADKLGSNYQAQGNVTIFTEKAACSSCKGVVDQFMKLYPNVRVNIIHNKGERLIP